MIPWRSHATDDCTSVEVILEYWLPFKHGNATFFSSDACDRWHTICFTHYWQQHTKVEKDKDHLQLVSVWQVLVHSQGPVWTAEQSSCWSCPAASSPLKTQMLKVNGVQHSAMFCSDANTPSKVKKEESLPFLTPLKMKAQTKQPKLSIYLIIIICLLSSLFVYFNSFSKCFLWTIIKLSIS